MFDFTVFTSIRSSRKLEMENSDVEELTFHLGGRKP